MKAIQVVKLLVVMLVLLAVQTPALAQRPPRMSPEERAAQLKKDLTLNDDQVAAITKILQAQDEQMRKMFESAGDDRSGIRDAMTQKRKETDEKIMALLSDEQKTAYTELQKNRQNRPERPQRK